MSSTIIIQGLTEDDKVPGAYGETNYGRGKRSVGSGGMKCLITGNPLASGSVTADQDIVPIPSVDDADALAGAGSEGAMQAYAALQIDGVELYYAPVAEAAGATAAALTATFGGSWSEAGTVYFYVADGETGVRRVAVSIGKNDDTTAAAAAAATAFSQYARLPMSAAAALAVTTLTIKSKGTRGNKYTCRVDLSEAPAGLTCALAGGTALTGGVTPFSGGAGADDVTNVLALLTSGTYDFQPWAQDDPTNAALIEAQLVSEAGALVGHMEHAVFARCRTQSDAIGLSQTTLNAQRGTVLWFENCELPGFCIAAQAAAARSVLVPSQPNYNFDDYQLPTVPPQTQAADMPDHSEFKAALNAGLTPLRTDPDGKVRIVRAIVSHCLDGSNPDYRTLDWGDADVPDRVRKEAAAEWGVFKASNPWTGPDSAEGSPLPDEQIGYPSLWQATLYKLAKDGERNKWLEGVDDDPPQAEWDSTAKRIMSAVPCHVRSQNHQVGIQVNQIAS